MNKTASPSTSVINGVSRQGELFDSSSDIRQEQNTSLPTIPLSDRQKWALLALFSFSLIVDQWAYFAFFIYTPKISSELSIPIAQQSWIVTSYLITFGSTILLFGRVSDLYSPNLVFSYGFLILSILNLIISFLPDCYSFFIFRALSGIAGASLIPSALKLITSIFQEDNKRLSKAITLYTSSAPVGGSTGMILAGTLDLIQNQGQLSSWRWFSRIMAILVFIPALGSFFWIPKSIGLNDDDHQQVESKKEKFKRLDLGGSIVILTAVLLLILSLTMGGDHGFKTAYFIAPFIISIFLFPIFILFESKLPKGYPLLPPTLLLIKNVSIFLILALIIYSWWSVNNFALINIWLNKEKEKSIIGGVRLLPQPIAGGTVALVLSKYSKFTHKPRLAITIGMILSIVGYVLLTQSGNQVGKDYWKFVFPGTFIGSGGAMMVYSATNVGVMMALPPAYSGIAGGLLQVSFQVGAALSLGIQAGLMTINEGSFNNFKNVQASLYFELGWLALGLIVFLVGYRNFETPPKDEESS